jgi:outer membrane biosynthesis protein TonB
MEATPMKLVGIISTAVLSLALGASAPAFAQQEQHDQQEESKTKPAQDEKKAQPEKPATQEEKSVKPESKNNQQEEKNAQRQSKNNQQEEKSSAQQEKNTKQQENAKQTEKNVQEHLQQSKSVQQEQHASNGGGRIPEDRYKANFGNEHRFRVTQSDYSNRRFQYGGYWFGFQGSWPSNWLYTQDVYVMEINGVYYLCNANYPGVNIVLSVTL